MRSLVIISLFSLSCINSSFAQDSIPDSLSNEVFSVLYILEDLKSTSGPKLFPVDESPNFLQVDGEEALLSGRFRGNTFYLLGAVDGFKESVDRKGADITSFFVRGRERSIGMLMSFEIIKSPTGEVVVHYYKKMGGTDVYFNAHAATLEEIEAIKKYWRGEN